MAKPSPRKKRAKRKTSTSKRRLRFSPRAILLILLGFSLPCAVYVVYLDRHVVSKFEGKRFALPARVYARPLELFAGKTLNPQNLVEELKLANYQAVQGLQYEGGYRRDGNAVDIYLRPFQYWDGQQDSEKIRVDFSAGTINRITALASGDEINLRRLEPISIGGIYPNQGEDRELVRLDQVPQSLINALIAIEDKRFYQHHGVDPKAVLRALSTIFSGGRIQGGSTITQQLIKNFYLTQDRKISRKIKEMVMAILLELHYDKDEILETYINEVYFGQDKNRAIHGFGLASQFYFSRDIETLDTEQAALLVGLLKGPTYYNPRKHPERAKQRRNLVLKAMAEQNFIGEKDLANLSEKTLAVSAKPNRGQSMFPAFLDLVVRQLKRDYKESDLRSEGLRIFTTLNPLEQKAAEKALVKQLDSLEKSLGFNKNYLEAAVVVATVPDGEISALIGGHDPGFQGFNRALDASRQIGSLIKPAIYLSALMDAKNYHLASPIDDSPFSWSEPGIDDWQPQNYDKQFHGEVPLWLALAKSYNVAAARLGTTIGVEKVLHTLRMLGVEKSFPPYASSLLGTTHLSPFEVAQMYHTLASNGFRTPFRAIREVTTKEGQALNRYDLDVEPVIPANANYLVTRALQEVINQGTGASAYKKLDSHLQLAGKTGTTDDLKDSWFAGFSADKVAVVWIGNDGNKSINLTGATGALRAWSDIMLALSPQPLRPAVPSDIHLLPIDVQSGFIASESCANTFTLPVAEASLENIGPHCSEKPKGKIKSLFRKLRGLMGGE